MAILDPYINHQFNCSIWRLEIDEISETICIEVRNDAEKQVSFSAISLVNGQINFKDFTTPERWLTGIEIAHNGVLLLHNYQSATGPAHRGLLAVDAITGAELWSNYIYAYDHISADGPVMYDTRIQPRKLFLADIKTGAAIRPYNALTDIELKNNIVVPQLISVEYLPSNLLHLTPYGNSLHYLDYNNFRIVSLHALQAGQLKQYLYVFDGDDKVYEDLLNTPIQKLQPEAFILHKNRLIYIKNKSALKVLEL